jgi:hypothetical protein
MVQRAMGKTSARSATISRRTKKK